MSPSDPKSSQTTPLGFDEFIGIFVAFTTIGAILFWSFSRSDSTWNLEGLLLPKPTPYSRKDVPPSRLYPTPPTSPTSSTPPTPPTSPTSPTLKSEPFDTLFLPNQATPKVVPPPVTRVVPYALPQVQAPVLPVPIVTTPQPSVAAQPEKMPVIPPPIAFVDVPTDFWARPFIDTLSSRGMIKGFPDNSYKPNQPVSRAEFAAILQQAFNKEPGSNTVLRFKDIPEKFWAIPAIDQGISTGFLKGYPDQTFKPEQRVSRVQVLVALVSGLNLKVPSDPTPVLSTYKDTQDIPNYATDRVAAATANSLVVNYPDPKILAPNKEATRAEVAAMVYQALVQMGKLEPIQSQNIVVPPR